MTPAKNNSVFSKLRSFLTNYTHFKEYATPIVLAYWIAATYIFEMFDTFPYLVVTAKVKRAGKTRLGSELISFTARVPQAVAGASAAALYALVQDYSPTLIWDEAETLNKETANVMRAFLNVGYRKGQTIPRRVGKEVVQWPTFCPKVFILIGDVYDTLRDRSIIVEMERGETPREFFYETAKAEGFDIAEELKDLMAKNMEAIQESYLKVNVNFLTDREREIWRPIFALCQVFEPENFETLQRLAADMSADKTNPLRYTEDKEASAIAADEDYAKMLLRDFQIVAKGYKKAIPSVELLEKIKAIPTSPWRRYHSPSEARHGNTTENGSGLTVVQMCYLVERYDLHPDVNRVGGKVFRGYKVESIRKAAEKHLKGADISCKSSF